LLKFQTLIGILQTLLLWKLANFSSLFQTLIGILQTVPKPESWTLLKEFQTLIGILQTALFLALFKLLSSF